MNKKNDKLQLVRNYAKSFLRRVRRATKAFLYEDRMTKLETWNSWLEKYSDNPFRVSPEDLDRSRYDQIAKQTLGLDWTEFKGEIERDFGFLPPQGFVEELARQTQFIVREEFVPHVHLHGYLLYSALRSYIARREEKGSLTILETGTARGFSSICMAKAMADSGVAGKVITVDILPSTIPIYWNCVSDLEGKKSRIDLLSDYQDLVEEYLVFLQGPSEIVLTQLGVSRVHFAFLDAVHELVAVRRELGFLSEVQKEGDVVILDDYTPEVFPGVVQAFEEFTRHEPYTAKLYRPATGRAYMYSSRVAGSMSRKED